MTNTVANSRVNDIADETARRSEGILRGAINTVKDESSKVVEGTKEFAENGAKMAKETAKEAYDEIEKVVKNQSDTIIDYIKERPVKSMFIALGVGYMISCISSKK